MTTKPKRLATTARAAFAAFRDQAPKERFYLFALCTTEDGSFVRATAWSEEALERAIEAYRAREPQRSAEEQRRRLRFCEPAFHSDEDFAAYAPGKKLHDACFDALRELDGAGFFGKSAGRSKTLINVVYRDMSDEQWLENANRLNSRAAVARALPFLRPR